MNTVLLDINDSIATLTLNRPEVRHAFNEVMVNELLMALKTVAADSSVRVLVLKSKGPVFCAGADLSYMQKMVQYTEAENKADASQLAALMHSLYTLNKPTLALVQGHAYGGGVGLIACCDIVLAVQKAQFCFSEAKLGLSPSVISPYAIRAIGLRQAQRYFLTAQPFDAKTAQHLGLVHECVLDEKELSTQADTFIQQLLKNGPKALAQTKKLLQHNAPISAELINYTIDHISKLRASAEGQSGIQAFLNRTTAPWEIE
ncbi:MAG: enoyl-CoA hydratase/isomerase family protein [Gammaproteobacteria bacterium]|nr:enoyl-CoA hydratase/isomerase family protein [Gammaproteobacteria bacterium]